MTFSTSSLQAQPKVGDLVHVLSLFSIQYQGKKIYEALLDPSILSWDFENSLVLPENTAGLFIELKESDGELWAGVLFPEGFGYMQPMCLRSLK